jgi:hypothetical protein
MNECKTKKAEVGTEQQNAPAAEKTINTKSLPGASPVQMEPAMGESAVPAQTAKPTNSDDTEHLLYTTALDVVDKQYRLMTWNDAKTQNLLTTNSLLFATIAFLYSACSSDSLAMGLLGMSAILIALSLHFCLYSVGTRLLSGRSGDEPNTRSMRGITMFDTWSDYRDAFMLKTRTSFLEETLRQIYGLATNNTRSVKRIQKGVALTWCSVILLVGAIFAIAVASKGHHLLGARQPLSSANRNQPLISP